ncbi:class I SAM-dependent methyltransferase [Patescibacteria group bacterium]|nr:class I SAM-dependent methyltransferase [Patescibacteria group bacterium]
MQENIWEKEYKKPKLVTGHDKPQAFFVKFIKYLRKEKNIKSKGLNVLDLGSGTGRNTIYLAQNGAQVVGMEISDTAITLAQKRTRHLELDIKYLKQSIGSTYPFGDNEFDLIIDVTSSNSLDEKEREVYLDEVHRVLKKDGIFFVRALCKDGDKNAKFLLKNNPGEEKDTYIMPGTELQERVFSEEDFRETYSKYFNILKLEKTESYSKVGGRVYKRRFWLAVMGK